MHGNCSIAMLLAKLLAGLIVLIAVLGSQGNSPAPPSDVKNKTRYPWENQSTTHRTPYKISGDI